MRDGSMQWRTGHRSLIVPGLFEPPPRHRAPAAALSPGARAVGALVFAPLALTLETTARRCVLSWCAIKPAHDAVRRGGGPAIGLTAMGSLSAWVGLLSTLVGGVSWLSGAGLAGLIAWMIGSSLLLDRGVHGALHDMQIDPTAGILGDESSPYFSRSHFSLAASTRRWLMCELGFELVLLATTAALILAPALDGQRSNHSARFNTVVLVLMGPGVIVALLASTLLLSPARPVLRRYRWLIVTGVQISVFAMIGWGYWRSSAL
jgi:hypothetical protein